MSTEKTEIETFFGRCRCCLSYGYLKNMWSEHTYEGEREVYGDMLVQCFSLSWEHTIDTMGNDQICDQCVIRLRDACDFKRVVLESQAELMQQMAEECEITVKEEDCNDEFLMVYKDPDSDTVDTADDPSVKDEMEYEDIEYLDDEVTGSAREALIADSLPRENPPIKRRKTVPKTDLVDDSSTRKWPKRLPKAERLKTYKQYTEENLRQCMDAVRNGEMTPNEASSIYKIPKKTICAKMRNDPKDIWTDVLKSTSNEMHMPTHTYTESMLNPTSIYDSEAMYYNRPEYQWRYLRVKDLNDLNLVLMYSNANLRERNTTSGCACIFCDQKVALDDLKQHMYEHKEVVDQAIRDNIELDISIKVDVAGLKCTLCDSYTSCLEEFKLHLQVQHNKAVHLNVGQNIPTQDVTEKQQCAICYKEFQNTVSLKEHMGEHYRNYECEVCRRPFIDEQSLQEHIIIHSAETGRNVPAQTTAVIKPAQNKRMKSVRHQKKIEEKLLVLNKHKNNVKKILLYSNATMFGSHSAAGYSCCFCDKQCSPAELKKHTLEHGDVSDEVVNSIVCITMLIIRIDITGLKCRLCDQVIDDLDKFMAHLQDDHNKTIYTDINNHIIPFKFEGKTLKCALCSKEFTSYVMLKDHMNEHYNHYPCAVCKRPFTYQMALSGHSSKHQWEPDVPGVTVQFTKRKCELCDVVCGSGYHLRVHESQAHGIDYSINNCDRCGRPCYTREALVLHKNTEHIPLRLFKCMCGDAFLTRAELDTHKEIIHKKPYECKTCKMGFISLRALNRHIPKHFILYKEEPDFFSTINFSTGL